MDSPASIWQTYEGTQKAVAGCSPEIIDSVTLSYSWNWQEGDKIQSTNHHLFSNPHFELSLFVLYHLQWNPGVPHLDKVDNRLQNMVPH